MTEFVPSPFQQAIFDFIEKGRGSAIVEAVAGSGKTTTIMKALGLIRAGASVQVLAFNSAIAKELKAKMPADRPGFRAGTFHSLGFGAILKRLSKPASQVSPDGNKVRNILRNILGEGDYADYGDFCFKLVGLAKGEGIGPLVSADDASWLALINHHDFYLEAEGATEEKAVAFARAALIRSNELGEQGVIDFDDMLYLPLLWRLRLWQNDFVFVDEAQDTNPVRRAIAKLALRPGGRLIAVGDPRQAIYGFTGASHDALNLIAKEFNAIRLPLSVSYRCPQAVVRKAQEVVSHIEAAPSAIEGSVDHLDVEKALEVLGSHDAILCRNTAPLIQLAYRLIARGRGCAVLGREIGQGLVNLVKKMKAKGIDGLVDKLEAYREREVARHTAKGEEQKAEAVSDRVACVLTVVENLPEGGRTIPKLIERIESLFTDSNGVLILSTCHKAKGREWDRVAIYRPDLMPSRWARQEWQQVQEQNLMYVAYTRAKQQLIFVEGEAR